MFRHVFPFLVALFIIASSPILHAQGNWRGDPQNASRENLWNIAFDGQAFVAVGERGTILYSDYEGAGWQTRPSGTDVWLVGVGAAGGRWIAVGDAGTILVSDDRAETWTPRASGTSIRLNAIVHGNGRWVAVGEQGVVLTSTDNGETWTLRSVPHSGFLRALAFGQNQFVFGGSSGALFATADGATFTRVALPTTADVEAAAITPGRIFLAGSRGLRAAAVNLASPWQIFEYEPDGTIRGLVARSETDATVVTDRGTFTYNGGQWSGTSLRPNFLVTSIALGRDEAVAVGFGGGVSRSSSLYNVAVVPGGVHRVEYGHTLRLQAVATGTVSTLNFQWQHNSTDIPGATTAELTIPTVTPVHAGVYSVRASSASSTLLGNDARIEVVPAGSPPSLDSSFAFPFATTPAALVPLPDAGLLVLGTYTGTPGTTQRVWRRLHANGTVDESFRAAPLVSDALMHVLPDGRLYAETITMVIADRLRPGAVRLLPDGSIDSTFSPDPDLVERGVLRALPDGRVYVRGREGIVRLLPDGRRDSTFQPITDLSYQFVGIDDAGRIYVTKPGPIMLWVYPATGHRFLSDGTRDTSFELNLVNRTVHAVATGAVFGAFRSYGRFGSSTSYFRANAPASAPPYTPPPWSHYPDYSLFRFLFEPDGSVWDFRYENSRWVVRAYSPTGERDPTHWLTLPDNATYTPLALAHDGAIYARRDPLYTTTNTVTGAPLVRLRPRVGRPGRLTNLSIRASIASADAPLIAGFVTGGSGETRALLRAVGPGLAPHGVTDILPDPELALVVDATTHARNADWPDTLADRFAAVGAFPLTIGSRDAALETPIGPGDHSAIVTPAAATAGGTALIELYESAANDPHAPRRFVNLSARGVVSPGRPLIAGFTISGDVPARLLVRAAGPVLKEFGVTDPLANPRLRLYRDNVTLFENDNWSALNPTLVSSNGGSGAFPFPIGSADAAMLVTLAPGSYTAVVEPAEDGATGTVLVEVYELPLHP